MAMGISMSESVSHRIVRRPCVPYVRVHSRPYVVQPSEPPTADRRPHVLMSLALIISSINASSLCCSKSYVLPRIAP